MAVNPGGLSLGVTRKGYQVRERWNLSPTCFSSRHRSTVRLVHLKGNILNHRGAFFFFFWGGFCHSGWRVPISEVWPLTRFSDVMWKIQPQSEFSIVSSFMASQKRKQVQKAERAHCLVISGQDGKTSCLTDWGGLLPRPVGPGGSRWVGSSRLHPSQALQAAGLWVSSSKSSRRLLLPLFWGPVSSPSCLLDLFPQKESTPHSRKAGSKASSHGWCLPGQSCFPPPDSSAGIRRARERKRTNIH